MSAKDVDEVVIDAMVARFPPPKHVREDDRAAGGLLNTYRKALSAFRRPILEQGWELVAARQKIWCWPLPSEIGEACMEAQRKAERSGEADAWVQRAQDRADEYVKRFMKTSAVAARAREGGYEDRVKEYLRAASWVQSQMIEGRESVGYDGRVLFGRGPRDREQESEWFAKQREQAAKGGIQVRVPQQLMKKWEAECRRQGVGR